MEPLISVIMPVYNARDYLEQSIESVLSQTHTNLELILVDDGSTDGSGDICDAYKRRDERVIVKHTANRGQGRARNAGMDLSHGEWITFIDDDDYIEDFALAEMLRLAHEEDADMVIGGYSGYGFAGYVRWNHIPGGLYLFWKGTHSTERGWHTLVHGMGKALS